MSSLRHRDVTLRRLTLDGVVVERHHYVIVTSYHVD